jgi:hypothetical protein
VLLKGTRGPVVLVSRNAAYLAFSIRVDYVVDDTNRYVGGHHLDDVFVSAIIGSFLGMSPLIRRDP